MLDKSRYQRKIKPIIKLYGFITKNYTCFKLENYRIEFVDKDYQREYYFYSVHPHKNGERFYRGYNVDGFVNAINTEMKSFLRRKKIENILSKEAIQ